mmetsp:Transcript_32101/g.102233  ORF Transcript_32101/g.102233 Transcript_32101/m.102233 type:complete len:218 (+) Transcript_32101:288-941(+)
MKKKSRSTSRCPAYPARITGSTLPSRARRGRYASEVPTVAWETVTSSPSMVVNSQSTEGTAVSYGATAGAAAVRVPPPMRVAASAQWAKRSAHVCSDAGAAMLPPASVQSVTDTLRGPSPSEPSAGRVITPVQTAAAVAPEADVAVVPVGASVAGTPPTVTVGRRTSSSDTTFTRIAVPGPAISLLSGSREEIVARHSGGRESLSTTALLPTMGGTV